MSNLPEEGEASEPFPDFTNDFYSFLNIPASELIKGAEQERVKQILIIIAGTMGIGKTTLVENIIAKIQEFYGLENVNTVYTQVSTEVLMEYAFKGNPHRGWNAKKPVQVIIFDDATAFKLSTNDQRVFCSMRHRMMENTGQKEGIIYNILVTHDWYRLDPNFRRNAIVTCFLSVSPLDQYSRREYGNILGDDGVKYLSEKLAKALRFDEAKGIGLVVLPFKPNEQFRTVGMLKWKNIGPVDYIVIKKLPMGRLVFANKVKKNE